MPCPIPCPPPASAQTLKLGQNLVKNGDFSGTDSAWSESENYTEDSETGHGTVWSSKCDEATCMGYVNAQNIEIKDIISEGERYEATFKVDVKDVGTIDWNNTNWDAALSFYTIVERNEESSEKEEYFSDKKTINVSITIAAFGGGPTDGWCTYEAKVRVPKEADGAGVTFRSRCEKTESGECRAVAYFDNVSVVINKVGDSGSPNATSRVVTPKNKPRRRLRPGRTTTERHTPRH